VAFAAPFEIGDPQWVQNRPVSGSCVPQFTQKAMME
jgi:hypothetical protein